MKKCRSLLMLFVLLAIVGDCQAGACCTVADSSSSSLRHERQSTQGSGAKTAVLQEAVPLLQDGDLIFIRSKHPVFRRVAETTQSWESHVGILFHDKGGRWVVAESKVPLSKFTPLEKFVRRSERQRFLIERLKGGLTAESKERLLQSSRAQMGKLYDLGFNYDSTRLYCSKFVHDVYADTLGEEAGHVETFRQLILAHPDAPVAFWRLWFFGRIPWERRCITTTSVLHSSNLCTIFDSEIHAQLHQSRLDF